LAVLYQEDGAPLPVLPALPVSYAEQVRRESALLAGGRAERLWEFWRGELAGTPAGLDLPADRARPRVQSFREGARSLRPDPAVSARLKSLGRGEGATLFMTLLAGFQALLSRLTGQELLRVGSPTAGRGAPELAGVVGYFVNPVVL